MSDRTPGLAHQMVDYLKTSLSMRNSFPLAAHDQRAFDGFTDSLTGAGDAAGAGEAAAR